MNASMRLRASFTAADNASYSGSRSVCIQPFRKSGKASIARCLSRQSFASAAHWSNGLSCCAMRKALPLIFTDSLCMIRRTRLQDPSENKARIYLSGHARCAGGVSANPSVVIGFTNNISMCSQRTLALENRADEPRLPIRSDAEELSL